ncbi:signal peptidase I [Patescibacteria group bacterium]|nr:signal peptidase I [Patescibacteria group bacterium]
MAELTKPENQNETRYPSHPPSRRKEIVSIIGVIFLAIVFAVLITSYIFRSYSVDGPSMEPTLQNNDKLIIWKIPRTWAMITGHQWVPKRGSIVVFNQPNLSACGQATGKQLIKRVIGLPDDTVVINNGVVTIYGPHHPHGFKPDLQLAYNKTHFIQPTTPDESIHLNSHQLFVLGDNRPISCDSRRFGPINTSQLIGQLVLRFLPINKAETF